MMRSVGLGFRVLLTHAVEGHRDMRPDIRPSCAREEAIAVQVVHAAANPILRAVDVIVREREQALVDAQVPQLDDFVRGSTDQLVQLLVQHHRLHARGVSCKRSCVDREC